MSEDRKNAEQETESTEQAELAQPQEKTYLGMTRRTFSIGVGGLVIMLGLGGLKLVDSRQVLRPPGGQDEDRLISLCVRCQRCYEVCPKDVIVPTHVEDGFLLMRTPTLNFSNDFCDYCAENNGGVPLCVESCSSEALKLLEGATAENTIIGKAVINEDWCLAYKLIGCRFCYDACPYEAMELDEIGRPHVIDNKCNGCGACESVCVSLQNASIAQGADRRAIVIYPESEVGGVS